MNKLITNIDDLMLSQFIDCVCDAKLRVLVLSGEPSEADIVEAWSNLYGQYLDILGDAEALYVLGLQGETANLQLKIVAAEGIVKVLEQIEIEELVARLKEFGFETKMLKAGSPHFAQGLRKIIGRLAHLKLKLEGKEQELINYYKDRQGDNVSRQFFHKQLSRLSKHQGYPIQAAKTSVPEYVAILQEYLTQNKLVDDGQER